LGGLNEKIITSSFGDKRFWIW